MTELVHRRCQAGRNALGTLALALAGTAVAAAPAAAGTTTLNFDGLTNGTVVTTLSGATFEAGPTIFTPQHVATQSSPRALHTASACPSATSIGNACGRQVVTFASPASAVSLRLGLDDEAAQLEIPTEAQLKAYNASGNVVADSGDVSIGDSSYFPITRLVRVDSAGTDIVRVVLMVGTTDIYPSQFARRVNLDDFTFSDDAPVQVPAPTVRIDSPASGTTVFRADEAHLTGQVNAPAGVTRFCLSIESTLPASCGDQGVLDGSGRFSGIGVSGLQPGVNHVTAWVQDRQSRVASATIDITLSDVDLRPANLEVTQAVQAALPLVGPAAFEGPHTTSYNGVPLAAGKATFVRVWTDERTPRAGETVPGVRMLLTGARDGVALGAPLEPVNGLRSILPGEVTGPAVSDALRSSPTAAYIFQLPPNWTRGDVSLSAIVNPTGFASRVSECDGCQENNTLRVEHVAFTPVRTEVVTPVAEITRDASGRAMTLAPATAAFAATSAVSPFVITVRPYQAVIDITAIANRTGCDADCKNSAAFNEVTNFDRDAPASTRQGHIVGVNPGVARGLTAPVVLCCDPPRVDMLAVTDINRPLTSVAHEYYHQAGFRHAGQNCPGDPGGFGGLFAETWDTDNRGELHSFGFDPRAGSGGAPGRFAIAGVLDPAGNPKQFFDLMSYCTDNYPETNSWLSALNWTRAFEAHRATAATAGAAAAAGPSASAAATGRTLTISVLKVGHAGAVTHVTPANGRPTPAPKGKTNATISLLDGTGAVVARANTVMQYGHVDGGPGVVSVGTTLRDPGNVASTEVRAAGKLLARAKRPRTGPKVRILHPKRTPQAGSTGTVLLRWAVRGGAAKTTTIDFAADGRRFRPVVLGLTGHSYRVPVTLLAKGRHARLRVRVSDGWNEASAVSRSFASSGPPPVAEVTNLAATPPLSVDGTLQLEARGYGDHGRRLPGASLSWYYGHHLLGHGETVRVSGLPAGRQHLRLVARTGDGRHSSRLIPIDVVR